VDAAPLPCGRAGTRVADGNSDDAGDHPATIMLRSDRHPRGDWIRVAPACLQTNEVVPPLLRADIGKIRVHVEPPIEDNPLRGERLGHR